ncbi:MAG: hypothetical protein WD512_00155 [Candidatus Paceibacterota bacterium]
MSINWSNANANRFEEGIFTNTINERSVGTGVNVDGVVLKDGEVDTDLIKTDVIEEKTTNQRVSFPDGIKIDTIDESTGSARTSFLNGLKTNNIEARSLGVVTIGDELRSENCKLGTVSGLGAGMTIDLSHSNSSALSYFEVYTNGSALGGLTNTGTVGSILAGDLNILRINNFVILNFRLDTITTPTKAFEDFAIPARFQPTNLQTDRQMQSSSASATCIYIQISSSLRVGNHNFANPPALANFSTSCSGNICYYLD